MDFAEKLIELVRLNKVLYDLGDKNYKNVILKEKIWEEISQCVNKSAQECKVKWRNLRCSYRRVKNSQKRASGSASVELQKKWKYEDQMSFLREFDFQRNTTGNMESSKLETPESPLFDESDIIEVDFEEDSNEILSAGPSTSKPAPCPSMENYGKKSKRKDQTSDIRDFLKIATEAISNIQSTVPAERGNNSTTAEVFHALAKRIDNSNLPAYIIADIEYKVSNLVYEEIMKHKK